MDVYRAYDERVKCRGEGRPKERDEVLVVSLADAGSEPGAVVVQALDAAAAGATVDGTRWPIDVAGRAVLHLGKASVHHVEVLIPHVAREPVRSPAIRFVQEYLYQITR